MKFTLRLDPKRVRRWHVALADRLARRAGTRVSIEWSSSGEPLPTAVPLLLALERLVYGLPADDTATASRADLAHFGNPSGEPDLVLDLTAGVPNTGTNDLARTY